MEFIFHDNATIAIISGLLVNDSGVVSVNSFSPPINTPRVGDVVIGEVNRLNEKTAEIRILHIETNEEGHRSVPALKLFADIYVSDIVDRFIPSAGDAMRKRDIIKGQDYQHRTNVESIDKGSLGSRCCSRAMPRLRNRLRGK